VGNRPSRFLWAKAKQRATTSNHEQRTRS
jgi:hypothetical protein